MPMTPEERLLQEEDAIRARVRTLLEDPEASKALLRAIARRDVVHCRYDEILAALCVTVAGMMDATG